MSKVLFSKEDWQLESFQLGDFEPWLFITHMCPNLKRLDTAAYRQTLVIYVNENAQKVSLL